MNLHLKALVPCILCGLLTASGYAGEAAPARSAATTELTGYFLLDEQAVAGFGHAVLLIGSDAEGWDYYSFAPHPRTNGHPDNLEHRHFSSLPEAREASALTRYHKYLSWTTSDAEAASRVRTRIESRWAGAAYDPLRHNCFHMVADVLTSAGFTVDGGFVTPVAAFDANLPGANDHGDWPISIEEAVPAR
jgi:hypothetical protein